MTFIDVNSYTYHTVLFPLVCCQLFVGKIWPQSEWLAHSLTVVTSEAVGQNAQVDLGAGFLYVGQASHVLGLVDFPLGLGLLNLVCLWNNIIIYF